VLIAGMKASFRWLRELVPQLQASRRELADKLTGAGLGVEGMRVRLTGCGAQEA
jgi:hypothetical protein